MEKSFHDGLLDITMTEHVEVSVSQLGPNLLPVLHVNTKEGCVLRICMIRGEISFNDSTYRKKVIEGNGFKYATGDTVAIHGGLDEKEEGSLVHQEPKR